MSDILSYIFEVKSQRVKVKKYTAKVPKQGVKLKLFWTIRVFLFLSPVIYSSIFTFRYKQSSRSKAPNPRRGSIVSIKYT